MPIFENDPPPHSALKTGEDLFFKRIWYIIDSYIVFGRTVHWCGARSDLSQLPFQLHGSNSTLTPCRLLHSYNIIYILVFYSNFYVDELPTLSELMMLKYQEKGELRRVHIIEEASHKWKDIASLLCDDPNKVRILEQQHPGDTLECLRQTFIDEFLDKKPELYSQNWSGLIELLEDIGLVTLAKRVQHVLLYTGTCI